MEKHEKHEDETFDPEEIQICKPFSAVNDRIEYFLKRKREVSNDRNTRVYCNSSSNNYSGSSRTCSTIENKRQKTSECYIKTTKVYNNEGPYCIDGDSASESNNCTLSNNTNSDGLKLDLFERISNIETCLNIENNDDNMTVYEKLKSLEDRVLTLQLNWLNHLSKNQCNINNAQETTNITKKNLNNKHKELTLSEVLSKKSKYTAEDIQQLIRNIQNKR